MSDTATKIINLLERLSVKAPERCGKYLGIWHVTLNEVGDVLVCGANGFYVNVLQSILMAVLEEAALHKVMWYCEESFTWTLTNYSTGSMRIWRHIKVQGNWGGPLEREILPRLGCLVLMLEKEAQS